MPAPPTTTQPPPSSVTTPRYGEGGRGWAVYNESDYLALDAHVLSTPTVADVNNDGHVEIVLAVSYFFDRKTYEGTEAGKRAEQEGIDLTKYVGWLDLTT